MGLLLAIGATAIFVTDRLCEGPSRRALATVREDLSAVFAEGVVRVDYEDDFVRFSLPAESVSAFSEYTKTGRPQWVLDGSPVGTLTLVGAKGTEVALEYADPASLGIPGSGTRAWRLVPSGWQVWCGRNIDVPIIEAYQEMRANRVDDADEGE